MVFSDTTNKNGLIQECEFWTNLGDGTISGNTTLLAQFTSRINQAYDKLHPFLLAFLKHKGWDDTNNTDFPVATFNIIENQNDYTIYQDADSLDILTITDVAILPGAGTTDYVILQKMTLDDPFAPLVMSPNTDNIGIPSKVLINGNTIFFDVLPNFAATNGAKIYFSRDHYRFVSTDTTKTPGIPIPFHNLLALYAAKDWIVVNKASNTVLIETLNSEIIVRQSQLEDFIRSQNPTRGRMTTPFTPTTRSSGADSNK